MTDATYDLVLQRHGRPGVRGYLYDVILNGEVICTSRDPQYAACRALVALGLRGEARFWRPGRPTHDSCIRDIEKGALLFTREGANDGPRVAKYAPIGTGRRKYGRQSNEVAPAGVEVPSAPAEPYSPITCGNVQSAGQVGGGEHGQP